MFTIRQKLWLCRSGLFAALFVTGSFFGRRWLHVPNVEPVAEHLLSDRPRAESTNRPVRASALRDTSSDYDTDMISKDEWVHETVREDVLTAPFRAEKNSLDEESQTVRVC